MFLRQSELYEETYISSLQKPGKLEKWAQLR